MIVAGHQKQPALFAPHIPRPFAEPLDDVGHRGGLFDQFACEGANAFADQIGPAARGLAVQDGDQIRDRQQLGPISQQGTNEALHFAKAGKLTSYRLAIRSNFTLLTFLERYSSRNGTFHIHISDPTQAKTGHVR